MTTDVLTAKVLTANRLADGGVVYLTASGDWSEDLQDAATAADTETEAELTRQAEQAVARCLIVDPYLFPVVRRDGRLAAASQRERIRAAGPTVPFGDTAKVPAISTEFVHVSL